MELFRRKKLGKNPRVSTIIHHQGDQIVGKSRDLLKLSSSVGTQEENLCASPRPVGTTMKKLLADELKKESESGRRSPSVIANLMGLDWLPPSHNASKQHMRASDSYQKKGNSTGFGRSGKGNDGRSHRNHGKGQHKYKDVYEVEERSNVESWSTTSRATSLRNTSEEDDVAFVRQKFIDVKRLSTDEKLRHSKEFHDALEVLDSNKDLLLKFLQEPNSLFTKHLHHLHGTRESPCGRVEGMKSSNTLKCNVDVIGCHSSGEASQKIDISRSRKHSDECQCNLYHRHSANSHKLHHSVVGKEDTTSSATRIVVLKPNLGKARDSARSVTTSTPSCDLASDYELHNGYSNIMQRGSEMISTRGKRDDCDFNGTKSRDSRELAREVTRRMKNKLGADSFNVSSSGFMGYSADESSGDMSENDSSYDSEVTIPGSTTSSNRGINNKASTSASPQLQSSINREAKKRLSRRWKMTHKSQDFEPSVKGRTLAEMLAIPDVGVRPRNPDYVVAHDEHIQKCGRDEETTEFRAPFGISSRDGWKGGSGGWNSSRSRSHSASLSHLGSPKSSTRHEAITPERFLVRSRSLDFGKNKAFKRDSEINDGLFSEITRSRKKEIQLTLEYGKNNGFVRDSERKGGSYSEYASARNKEIQSTCVEIIEDVQVPSCANIGINSIDGKDSPDDKSVIIEMSSHKGVPLSAVIDIDHKSVNESLNCSEELVPSIIVQSIVSPDDCFSCDEPSAQQEPSSSNDIENSSCSHLSATQPESPASSKDSEQPSPVSVLEAPFVEEVSSGSECFERVSAELHGLRMQLQLLKQESETYDEGSMLISSDESEEESSELDNGKELHCTAESWESSYLMDVLTSSGLDETDLDMFLVTCHSPEYSINPCVFDNLERKYGGWKSCLRSERKLLFDRINAGIFQLFCQYVDIDPCVKPLVRNVNIQLSKDRLKTELDNLLKNVEMVVKGSVMGLTILGGMQWFKPGDHIGVVVRDIEQLLTDELVTEVLSM